MPKRTEYYIYCTWMSIVFCYSAGAAGFRAAKRGSFCIFLNGGCALRPPLRAPRANCRKNAADLRETRRSGPAAAAAEKRKISDCAAEKKSFRLIPEDGYAIIIYKYRGVCALRLSARDRRTNAAAGW